MFGAMADPPEKDVSVGQECLSLQLAMRCSYESLSLHEQDFYFKQLRKIKIGDVTQAGCCSLICTSNEYGWTFVGCNKG